MSVLTFIPNNTSARDWRDTMNALLKRVAALEAAGVPVETPAPAFTTQPSVSPTSGTAGSTVYAATPGTVSNGSVVSRAWLLNGTAISTGVTAVPASAGTLTYQETASGPGGTTTSTVQVAAVTAATITPTPAPSFTSQPSISPNTGTAGTTTFTATPGNVSNGSSMTRSWTINGTVISTGLTASPASSGTLTYQETATGPGGTTQSTVQQVTVATAAAAAPAFTSQPTVSPSTGTAGTTTYTATPGAVSNGTITSRAWALNGSTISTGLTAAPASAGTLTYQEFATGAGGSASSSILTRTVSAATPAGAGVFTFALAGSSTFERYLSQATTADSRVERGTDGTTFTAVGTTGAALTQLGALIADGSGATKVRFITRANGGTTLASWEVDGSGNRANLVSSINNSTAAGIPITALVVGVGFNDAQNSESVVSRASHAAMYRSFLAKVRAETNLPNLKVVMAQSQRKTLGASAATNIQLSYVRAAEYDVSQDANNYLGVISYDLPQISDGIHFTQPEGFVTHATRLARNVLAAIGFGTRSIGPRFTAITPLTSTTTRVTLAHGTGTDFTPTTGITGAQLVIDGAPVAITSLVRESATRLIATHTEATTAGKAILFRYAQGAEPDVSASVHDNTTLALPVLPTADDLSAVSLAPVGVQRPIQFADDFTVADGTDLNGRTPDVGMAWSVVSGTYNIDAGAAHGTVAGNAYSGNAISSPDCYTQARFKTVTTPPSNGGIWVLGRVQDASTFYQAGYRRSVSGFALSKTVAGTYTELVVVPYTLVAGDIFDIALECQGTTLRMIKNGQVIATVEDTAISVAGKAGIRTSASGASATSSIHCDNIKAGPLS